MRSLTGLGMAALVVAAALTTGCGGARIRELEFQNRNLNASIDSLHVKVAGLEGNLTLATSRATQWEQQAKTQGATISSLQSQGDAARRADKAMIADLKKQIEAAAAMDPGQMPMPLPKALDAKLKQFAAAFPQIVTYEPRTGMVKYANMDLLFELGSDNVLATARSSLGKLAEVIKSAEATGFDIIIVGHTDTTRVAKRLSVARYGDNWGLSAFRARSVMKALAAAGVPKTKMAIMGFGQYRPVAAKKAKNRRVEIFFERANRFSPGTIEAAAPLPVPVPVPVP